MKRTNASAAILTRNNKKKSNNDNSNNNNASSSNSGNNNNNNNGTLVGGGVRTASGRIPDFEGLFENMNEDQLAQFEDLLPAHPGGKSVREEVDDILPVRRRRSLLKERIQTRIETRVQNADLSAEDVRGAGCASYVFGPHRAKFRERLRARLERRVAALRRVQNPTCRVTRSASKEFGPSNCDDNMNGGGGAGSSSSMMNNNNSSGYHPYHHHQQQSGFGSDAVPSVYVPSFLVSPSASLNALPSPAPLTRKKTADMLSAFANSGSSSLQQLLQQPVNIVPSNRNINSNNNNSNNFNQQQQQHHHHHASASAASSSSADHSYSLIGGSAVHIVGDAPSRQQQQQQSSAAVTRSQSSNSASNLVFDNSHRFTGQKSSNDLLEFIRTRSRDHMSKDGSLSSLLGDHFLTNGSSLSTVAGLELLNAACDDSNARVTRRKSMELLKQLLSTADSDLGSAGVAMSGNITHADVEILNQYNHLNDPAVAGLLENMEKMK